MTPVPWLGIEIRHLMALAAVARAGSFRGAADELGYVQSAISQQVAQLERVTGRRLVERSRGTKHVRLTHAGELLLSHIDEIVARFRAAQADVTAEQHAAMGEVHVGLISGLVPCLLPALMKRLGDVLPGVRLSPVEAPNDGALFEQLEQGALDMAFVEFPIEPGPFEHHALPADPWVLLTRPDSPLARAGRPPMLADVARLPLIAPSGSRSHTRIETLLAARGITPRIVLRTASEATVPALVGAGVGIAIVPRLSVDLHDSRIAAIELAELPPRSIALCWLRDRRHTHALRQIRRLAEDAVLALSSPRPGDGEPHELAVAA